MPESGTADAGYSGKPLLAKLGWKPAMASLAIAPPDHYADLVDAAPIATSPAVPTDGEFDFLHLFVRTAGDLARDLPALETHLAPSGMIWVSWPKKTSAMFIDLTEDGVRDVALPMGIVDVKVCAIDADWSGLKLMRRKTA